MIQHASPAVEWPEDIDAATLDKIVTILVEEGTVNRSSIVPEATLESLDLQSVDIVRILLAIEEKLGIYVPIDNELASARNLSEFIAPIAGSINSQARASASGSK